MPRNQYYRPRGVAPAVRTSHVKLTDRIIPDHQAQREARYEALANSIVQE